ncbi:MAG: hypothetical protein ABI681_13950 [Gemmatimonadales bacterium]
MRRRAREVRAAFHSAGATIPANAMSLDAIGIDETMAVRRLKRRAVIREAAPGLFYFDEDAWQALRAMRLRMAILMGGTVLLVAILALYGTIVLK